jgi:hypothetical protein
MEVEPEGVMALGDQLVQADPGIFAAHRVPSGWEIIAPSSDPFTPAYWRVAVLDQNGRVSHDQPPCGRPHPSLAAHRVV